MSNLHNAVSSCPNLSPEYTSTQLSPLLQDNIEIATLKSISRFTNFNEAVYSGFDTLPSQGLSEPFHVNHFDEDYINRMKFVLNGFWQVQQYETHAFKRHGNDSRFAAFELYKALNSNRENRTGVYAVVSEETEGSRIDHRSNLVLFGEETTSILTLPSCYLEALKAKLTYSFPKQNFLEQLNIHDLLLTCAYLDLPALIDRRTRPHKREAIVEAYSAICELMLKDDIKGFHIANLIAEERVDITYNGDVFDTAMAILTEVGVKPSEKGSSIKYVALVRRPIAVFSSVYNFMYHGHQVERKILKRLRNELSDNPLFTNHLATAYLETSLHYLKKDELSEGAVPVEEQLLKRLYAPSKSNPTVSINFGRRTIG